MILVLEGADVPAAALGFITKTFIFWIKEKRVHIVRLVISPTGFRYKQQSAQLSQWIQR